MLLTSQMECEYWEFSRVTKMFSLHLPKLTAAVTEHVPLENHKWAGCQVCRALWTEACQGLVSVKGHRRV